MSRRTKLIAVLLLAVVLVSAFSVAFAHTATTTANAWNSTRACKGTVSKGPSCSGTTTCEATVKATYFHPADPYGEFYVRGATRIRASSAESTSSIPSGNNYKNVSVEWYTTCAVGRSGGTRSGTVYNS